MYVRIDYYYKLLIIIILFFPLVVSFLGSILM